MREDKLVKILFTIPNFDTAGSGKALLNIVTRLDKTIFEPHICCFHNKGEYFNTVKSSGIPIHIFQTTTQMKPRLKGLFNCFKISKYLKHLNIDLIHSFHYAPDYSEALAAKIGGIPWVYTKKNMNWGGKSKNGWKLRTYFAKHVVAQNKSMLNRFFSNSMKVSLIPRGVDIKHFSPSSKNLNLLEQLSISKTENIFLTVANLVPVKGIEILLNAFESLSKKHDNITLLIVGDNNNEYGISLEEKSKKLKSNNKILFIGKVQNIIDYYSIADIFILPTLNKGRMEGCPVSLLEAMACGLSVLASDIPGIQDVLESFQDCLFNSGEVSKLQVKIEKLLINKEIKNIEKNRKHIKLNYSIEKEVKSHEIVYKKCLNL